MKLMLLGAATLLAGLLAGHALAQSTWTDMGGVNGASAYRFTDGPRVCYVVVGGGSEVAISCVR